jgi:CCR4-NOT transcriptional complex subunit CAF120
MEGWVQIRLAGQTDWKRYYMVVSAGQESSELARSPSIISVSPTAPRHNKRISNLFQRDSHTTAGGLLPRHPLLELFHGNKAKDKRIPVLTMREVTQAFSVYPERPEMINVSTLLKLEGLLGDESAAGGMKSRAAWMMVMPETEGRSPSGEMLKWVMGEFISFLDTFVLGFDCWVALHDAFELYGRPGGYIWDPRNRFSQMFGYPVGPHKDVCRLHVASRFVTHI